MADNRQYRPSLDIWNRDPRLIFILVNTIVAGTAAFGLALNGEQVGVIMGVANVLLALIYNSELMMPVSTANAQIQQALYTPIPGADNK